MAKHSLIYTKLTTTWVVPKEKYGRLKGSEGVRHLWRVTPDLGKIKAVFGPSRGLQTRLEQIQTA